MRDYYTDFLQNINSVNTLPIAVSKVSKGQNLDKKQAFDTFDTALTRVYQKNYVPKNNDELADFKAEKLHEVLNRYIEAGITFDVSADDFYFIDPAQILKLSDMEFLKLNDGAILCQLQQSLLMKHLFNHSPEQFEDFAFEIKERESIFSADCLIKPLSKTAETQYQFYFEAVKSVTKKWFAELLNKKT
jgi:hypothetical protein